MKVMMQSGMTLLEVLIAMVVMAFAVLGLAGLQAQTQMASIEAYQRAQAVMLNQDLKDRVQLDRANAPAYVTGIANPLGTGDDQPLVCNGINDMTQRNLCEWSTALKGAAVLEGERTVGGMIDARGCVEQLQAANPDPAVCQPAIYRITTVWQGLSESEAPFLGCAAQRYGAEGFRRAISTRVVVGLPDCG